MPIPIGLLGVIYVVLGLIGPLLIPFVYGGLWACTIHPVLWLTAPRRKSFRSTVCTTFYSFSPYALMVIPICGGSVANVWQIVVLIIGIKETHGVNGWIASLAVLWPIVAVLTLYLLFLAILFLGLVSGW